MGTRNSSTLLALGFLQSAVRYPSLLYTVLENLPWVKSSFWAQILFPSVRIRKSFSTRSKSTGLAALGVSPRTGSALQLSTLNSQSIYSLFNPHGLCMSCEHPIRSRSFSSCSASSSLAGKHGVTALILMEVSPCGAAAVGILAMALGR